MKEFKLAQSTAKHGILNGVKNDSESGRAKDINPIWESRVESDGKARQL
ncbi:MAG: hypothetical protein PUG65_03330 [Firmicutes bacterium]|nr:hypothetical protein [Bacillota bacterium]